MDGNKIAKNTVIQSLKLVANIFIGLYSTRLTIQYLGVTNFGAFSLLGGIVTMLALLKSTLTNTSLRYLSYTSGIESQQVKNEYYNSSIFLHLVVGLFTWLLVTIVGIVCFEYDLVQIPVEIHSQAFWAYHILGLLTLVSITNSPFDALLVSKENFTAIAIADLLLSIFKVLGIIALSLWTSFMSKLLVYSILILSAEILARLFKYNYVSGKYKDYNVSLFNNTKKEFLKEMMSFSLWNLVGTVTVILRRQANALIINNFVGIIANAANSLARTVQGYINNFSINITKAITPQMMRGEGQGNRKETIRLTNLSAKYSTLIFLLLFIPLFFELEYILRLWLGDIPQFTIVFTKLALIYCLIEKLSSSINTALMAVGEIKQLQILELTVVVIMTGFTVGVYGFMNVPELIFYNAITISLINIFVRLYLGKKHLGLSVKDYIIHAVMPVVIPSLFALAVSYGISSVMEVGFLRLIMNSVFTAFVFVVSSLFFALTKEEKKMVLNKIK